MTDQPLPGACKPQALTYADAGVSRDEASRAVERIKAHCRKTFLPGVMADIGSFGALFRLELADYIEPVLVSSTDGVGTKLRIAFELDKHDTVGIDLVAMCANDVVAQGAKPLFFLDYYASGRMQSEKFEQVVAGIAAGCQEAGCALIGGENAELPGFYQPGEYDLAGFCVGVTDKDKIVDGSTIEPSDVLLGLSSTGLHSNGYSLARKVLLEVGEMQLDQRLDELGCTLGEELLRPTRIYAQSLLPILDPFYRISPTSPIKGIAHVTGGGFLENIPRILPPGVKAVIRRGAWREPPIFGLIQRVGNVPTEEMFRTFNMGIGMVLVVAAKDVPTLQEQLKGLSFTCSPIGVIKSTSPDPSGESAAAPSCVITE